MSFSGRGGSAGCSPVPPLLLSVKRRVDFTGDPVGKGNTIDPLSSPLSESESDESLQYITADASNETTEDAFVSGGVVLFEGEYALLLAGENKTLLSTAKQTNN